MKTTIINGVRRKLCAIAVLLTVIVSPQIVMAYDFEVDDIYYDITDNSANTVSVISCGSSMGQYFGDVTIPSTVTFDGTTYSVTSIGYAAFSGCSNLTSVTIGNSITYIGEYAFLHCSGLTSVIIPNSVTTIESSAFMNCSGLTSVTIPNSVTSIGGAAFLGTPFYNNMPDGVVYLGRCLYNYKGTMPKNTSIAINDGTVSISSGAFSNCDGLKSVTIPNSVTSIGGSAFASCSGLTSVTIPNSVTSIGGSAFSNCDGLKSVTIPNSVTSIDDNTFYSCSGLASVTIPNSVTTIGNYVFYCCKKLSSVIIPNSVTSIGEATFIYCSGLTSVTIPNYVTSIGGSAFASCSGLTSVTIGNSVKTIGGGAFSSCSGLTSVTLGSSVRKIGKLAFSACSSIKDIMCYAIEPPLLYENTFEGAGIYSTCTVHVVTTEGCVDAYKADIDWSMFKNIIGDLESTGGVEGVEADGVNVIARDGVISVFDAADNASIEVYNAAGMCIYSGIEHQVPVAQHGIYIVKVDGKTTKVAL